MNNLALIYCAVAIGGALGACSRYALSQKMMQLSAGTSLWATGTLLANLIGGLIIGVMWVVLIEKQLLPSIYKPLLITGFLGGLTTFSSFSLESLQMILKGDYWQALVYVALSVLLCLLACFSGVLISRLFL